MTTMLQATLSYAFFFERLLSDSNYTKVYFPGGPTESALA